MSGNVTVGVDGSPESPIAVRWAAYEAGLGKAPLHLVRAGEWPFLSRPLSPHSPTRSPCADRILRSAAEGLTEGTAPEAGLELRTVVSMALEEALAPWQQAFPAVLVGAHADSGVTGAQVVHASAGADLLIVGRHERRAPLGPRMGHVVHAVIHHAAAPVVVVPQTRRT